MEEIEISRLTNQKQDCNYCVQVIVTQVSSKLLYKYHSPPHPPTPDLDLIPIYLDPVVYQWSSLSRRYGSSVALQAFEEAVFSRRATLVNGTQPTLLRDVLPWLYEQ